MPYARLLHCTHHAGASVGWFMREFGWMSAMSGWSLLTHGLNMAFTSGGHCNTQIPRLFHRLSHLAGPVVIQGTWLLWWRELGHSDIPGALVTSLSNVVHQNVNRKVQLFSGSTTCCVLLFIGYHKMSCCLWAFTICFHGECGNFNTTGLWKPTDANISFQ